MPTPYQSKHFIFTLALLVFFQSSRHIRRGNVFGEQAIFLKAKN